MSDPTRLISQEDFEERARKLEWLLFDVDGVLTDGRLWYTPDGEQIKPFHVRDGLALKLAQRTGLKVGVFTGRTSLPLERRAKDLALDEVILGSRDKRADFAAFLARRGTSADRVAFTGDDLIDLPALGACGLALCPKDAVPEVQEVVHRVIDIHGGHGVVRNAIEQVLKARGEWERLVASFAPEV